MKVARSVVIALMLVSAPVAAASTGRGVHQCLYNCPPPTGGISAPVQVAVPAGGRGTVQVRWTWNQSRQKPVTQYSCLWVSAAGETEAHIVQCERPRHTYTANLSWIDVGAYTFRVAPGNPNGPYTRPIAVLQSLAQTTVFGVAQ
jgi:hypothetical protein